MSSELEAACSSNAEVITYMVTQPRKQTNKQTRTRAHAHTHMHVRARARTTQKTFTHEWMLLT